MAKIVITVKDLENGGVCVESNPQTLDIMKIDRSGHNMTNAEGVALCALKLLNQTIKHIGTLKDGDRADIIIPHKSLYIPN